MICSIIQPWLSHPNMLYLKIKFQGQCRPLFIKSRGKEAEIVAGQNSLA